MPNKTWLTLGLALLASAWCAGAALAQTPVPPDVAAGAQLYADNCQMCHGERGEGRTGARLRDFPAFDPNTPRNLIKDVVMKGVAGSRMPAWKDVLTESEINAIVEYVVSWTSGGAVYPPTVTPRPVQPIPTLAGVPGDPARGQVVFEQNCRVCHGERGEGRAGARLARPLASAFPQAYVQNVVQTGIERTTMPGWRQVLSDEQIQDVTAYVLSLKPVSASAPTATPAPAPGASAWSLAIVFAAGLLALIAIMIISSRRRQA